MWVMLIPFVLIPIAAFITAFCVGAVGLRYLVKRSKFSQTQTSNGEMIHVESPIGTLDVHSEAKLDPRLAGIPLYPGAMPENPTSAETVTQVTLAGRKMCDISATYWTPDPASQVWEFYRNAMPDWPRNLSGAHGKELIHQEPTCVRLIRIAWNGDRTVIETSIKPPNYPNLS